MFRVQCLGFRVSKVGCGIIVGVLGDTRQTC